MTRNYTPRRFAKRWSEAAPAYVLDVLDNKGKTADRYTVLFTYPLAFNGLEADKPGRFADTYIPYLGMSDAPTHPQGFSQWGEMTAHEAAAYRYRSSHERVRWLDLPEHIRNHVIARATAES